MGAFLFKNKIPENESGSLESTRTNRVNAPIGADTSSLFLAPITHSPSSVRQTNTIRRSFKHGTQNNLDWIKMSVIEHSSSMSTTTSTSQRARDLWAHTPQSKLPPPHLSTALLLLHDTTICQPLCLLGT